MTHPTAVAGSFDSVTVPEDMDRVRSLVTSTGNFNPEEVEMAVELVESRLSLGDKSGYFFLYSREPSGILSGYVCYGPIMATDGRFDLYWLVVRPEWHGSGLGKRLQEAAELAIANAGAKRIYLETSSTPGYQRARHFYDKAGYVRQCVLKDYYRLGDDNYIYMKQITSD
ncbi:MAG: GNAT family N-acetyltransferase [Magnetococcales bacterium]|nr:GNAT family N-acetyltransferase [Magnetococcales bacterium]MBF0150794.1 GNAT family N-acetyltransferase [Magnetococcales bacterium]MBF0173997.1 GNAT family N-acetyltransferase [Magnetococcales bacterium]MBF0631876.1 GNAT family N-acetyltransferase [Magnetococcales bacterium]